jgi:hypothetical protein
MLLIKNQMTQKKYLMVALFTISIFATDLYTSPSSSENVSYALFLGCGIKDKNGPCNDLGYRVVEHSVRIFGLQVGDSWTTEEKC